MHEQEAQLLLW